MLLGISATAFCRQCECTISHRNWYDDLSPAFMRDMMTEIPILHNARSTVRVEEDTSSSSLKCAKKSSFKLPTIKNVSYGLKPIWYIGHKIWKLVPNQTTSLEFFTKNAKCLEFKNYPCNLCKNWIYRVGHFEWALAKAL